MFLNKEMLEASLAQSFVCHIWNPRKITSKANEIGC
jgi:hypothetical protein